MAGEASASIANRDEPIPVLSVADYSGESTASQKSTSSKLRKKLSATSLKENARTSTAGALADRLFASILNQQKDKPSRPSTPTQQPQEPKPDRRSRKYVDRPGFSLPMMSTNFRRFNARIGVVFVFQNRAIRLFSWKQPSETLSFLAVYTICCLNPSLIAAIPVAVFLLFIMVPAFLARHPPPPEALPADAFSMAGPATALPAAVKPAPEYSKDFFRNMRDLQNSMEDFSVMHDKLVAMVAPLTNFADERLSSTFFLGLSIIAGFLFVASSIIPWRAIFLLTGYIAVCSAHPAAAALIAQIDRATLRANIAAARKRLNAWMESDILLDEGPELRQVEVFELQHHQGGAEWLPWIYSTGPFTPRSPSRVAGQRPRGTRFFEDVQAPIGWVWHDKKWVLDLYSREWVEERMISAVEVETEGERWVYDIGIGGTFNADGSRAVDDDNEEMEGQGEWRRRRWVRRVRRKSVVRH